MVLLVGALLFVRSYRNLVTIDPGMRESGITIGYFGFVSSNIKPQNEDAFKRQLLDDVRSVPGVENAGTTTNTHPLGGSSWEHNVRVGAIEGSSKFTYASPLLTSPQWASPCLTGRNFTNERTPMVSPAFVLIVNQAFVPPISQVILRLLASRGSSCSA